MHGCSYNLLSNVVPDVVEASTENQIMCWEARRDFLIWMQRQDALVQAVSGPSSQPPDAKAAHLPSPKKWEDIQPPLGGATAGVMAAEEADAASLATAECEEVRQWIAGLGLDQYADALLCAGWDCLEVRRPRRSLQAPRVMGAPPARAGRRRPPAPQKHARAAVPADIRRAWRCVAATATALTIQAAAAAAAAISPSPSFFPLSPPLRRSPSKPPPPPPPLRRRCRSCGRRTS